MRAATKDKELVYGTKANPSGLVFAELQQFDQFAHYPYAKMYSQAEAEKLAAEVMDVYLQLRQDPALLQDGRNRKTDVAFLEKHRQIVGQDLIDGFQDLVSSKVETPSNLILADTRTQVEELGAELDPDGAHELTFSKPRAAAWGDQPGYKEAFLLTFDEILKVQTTDEDVFVWVPNQVQIALRTGVSGVEVQGVQWSAYDEPAMVNFSEGD